MKRSVIAAFFAVLNGYTGTECKASVDARVHQRTIVRPFYGD